MKVVKKIINALTICCYIVIAAIVLLISPMVLGNRPMVVLSGSMEPTYEVGSLVYMKKTSFEDLKVGDVITYGESEDGLVTHRIVNISQISRTVVTRGDANDVDDPEITADKIKGKINSKLYIPKAGYVLQVIRKPLVIAGLAIILIVKIAMDFLIKDDGSKTEEKDTLSDI